MTLDDPPGIDPGLVETLREARAVLVTTHRSPDGDALGSALAVREILLALDKQVTVWVPRGVPAPYRFLPGSPAVTGGDDPGPGPWSCTLVVDTSEAKLLECPLPPAERTGPVLVLDHHLSGGSLGDLVVRLPAAATGELVWALASLLGVEPTLELAECVYTAIVTDTGMFRYDLTTPHTHRISARCLELGVQPSRVAREVWEKYPQGWLRLWSELLSTIEVDMDGRLATLSVPADLLSRHGANEDALEEVVSWPRGIRGVEVAALIRYKPDGRVRVSLRSNGRVNVASLASIFGGGGHFGAAGCDFPAGTSLDEARQRLREELCSILDR